MRPSCAALGAVAVALTIASAPSTAATLECPGGSVEQRLDAADASFVGAIVDVRPVGDAFLYTFAVDKTVKGDLPGEVTVLAEELVDADRRAVGGDVDAGVFLELEGATYTTDSCGLVDPSLLLAAADEPRGGAIKLAIGLVILAAVLTFALVRLKRRSMPR